MCCLGQTPTCGNVYHVTDFTVFILRPLPNDSYFCLSEQLWMLDATDHDAMLHAVVIEALEFSKLTVIR